MSTNNCSGVFERQMNMKDFAADHEEMEDDVEMDTGRVEVYVLNVEKAYSLWRQKTLHAQISPNVQQWSVLDLVHRRCLYEQKEGVKLQVNKAASGDSHWEPLFRMIHGLPGSGKSKLLLWLRTYFEEVWQWTGGVQFQFVAPLDFYGEQHWWNYNAHLGRS